jgi:hypothetical protein
MNLSPILFAGPADLAGIRIGHKATRAAPRWAARLSVLCIIALSLCPSFAMASAIEQLRSFATGTSSARGEFLQQQVRANGRPGEA